MGSDAKLPTIDSDRNSTATAEGTMQAIVQDTYGSADVLRLARIARPEVGDSEVLIRVHAASVHIGDWHVMTGLPYLLRMVGFGFRAPKARVRGMDVAGTVEAVGQNVTRFELGDDVFGTCAGSFAEQANARVDALARKPVNLSFEQAAAVPTSAVAALQALRNAGDIQPSDQVLIRHLRPLASEPNQADLQFLTERIEAGKITPVIDKTLPLSEVPDAIRYLHEGNARGKVVITV